LSAMLALGWLKMGARRNVARQRIFMGKNLHYHGVTVYL
jgi:hypothetical protein